MLLLQAMSGSGLQRSSACVKQKTPSIDAYNTETSSQLAFVFLAVHFPATCILALLRIVIDGLDVMSSP
jgi:hypothetical protein